jgi:hypothetical protein
MGKVALKLFVSSMLAGSLAGCATPMVKPDGPSMQSRVGFVKDWDALAEQAADRFVTQCPCDKHRVFVAPGPAHMAFATAYRHLLEDKLVGKGIVVLETSVGATVVLTFDLQTFLYDHTGRAVPLVLLPVGVAFDALASVYDTSRAEVLLTVGVSDDTIIRYRDPTEFYVRPSDLALYSVPSDSSHWANDNPASGIRVESPDNADAEDHPALSLLLNQARTPIIDGN